MIKSAVNSCRFGLRPRTSGTGWADLLLEAAARAAEPVVAAGAPIVAPAARPSRRPRRRTRREEPAEPVVEAAAVPVVEPAAPEPPPVVEEPAAKPSRSRRGRRRGGDLTDAPPDLASEDLVAAEAVIDEPAVSIVAVTAVEGHGIAPPGLEAEAEALAEADADPVDALQDAAESGEVGEEAPTDESRDGRRGRRSRRGPRGRRGPLYQFDSLPGEATGERSLEPSPETAAEVETDVGRALLGRTIVGFIDAYDAGSPDEPRVSFRRIVLDDGSQWILVGDGDFDPWLERTLTPRAQAAGMGS